MTVEKQRHQHEYDWRPEAEHQRIEERCRACGKFILAIAWKVYCAECEHLDPTKTDKKKGVSRHEVHTRD